MRKALAVAIVLFCPALAAAEENRIVSNARLTVADLATTTVQLGAIDLGPAPPPGGSRLIARAEVEDRVRAAGLDPAGLKLPKSVRVVGASERLSPDALAKLATGAVTRALPAGVTLAKIEPAHEIVVHPGCTVKSATIAKLPRQRGQARSTATLELATQDDVVTKIPVAITVDIGDGAAKADIPRGARVEVVLEHGVVHIATAATALADAEIGDTGNVSVVATGRIVRARFVSRERAELVERP
jgi:flagella basal body P-ring formation protein FlgA